MLFRSASVCFVLHRDVSLFSNQMCTSFCFVPQSVRLFFISLCYNLIVPPGHLYGAFNPLGARMSALCYTWYLRSKVLFSSHKATVEGECGFLNFCCQIRELNVGQMTLILSIHFLLYILGACPSPLKNRDVVTLRSWQVTDEDYLIVNFSVKHPVRRCCYFPHCILLRTTI